MSDSIPDYRRFAEATIQRVYKPRQRTSPDRLARILFNVVLLAGLWGVPLYARWMILSGMTITQDLPEAILGRWQIGEKGNNNFLGNGNSFLEFTPNQQLRLVQNNGVTIESAEYQIAGDVLMVFGFKLQPGDHDLDIEQQRYSISIRGDELTVTPSDFGFTSLPPDHINSVSHLRTILPPWKHLIYHFQRADNH